MIKLLSSSKYYQGFDILDDLGEHVQDLAKNFMVLCDPIFEDKSMKFLQEKKEKIDKNCRDHGVKLTYKFFSGEVTQKEIDRIREEMLSGGYDGLIALGGGKVVDAAKPAAVAVKAPLVVAPTIIAVNAPCSSCTVIYTEDHNVDSVFFAPYGPALVLVDTHVILKAPKTALIAGMGDALPTLFEGEATRRYNGRTIYGSTASMVGMNMARMCYESLLENGEMAVKAHEAGVVTPQFERIVQTNTFISAMAFEATGISAAHGVEDAINLIPEAQKVLHGYRVAYGTLCLILLEDYPMETFYRTQDFCARVGLPITLAEMHITENVEEKIRKIAPSALDDFDGCYNIPPHATEESVFNAIMMADKLGREYFKARGRA